MTPEALRKAMESEEEIEYHLMGNEQNADLIVSGPGWYSCMVEEIGDLSGNVEIAFTDSSMPYGGVTVLKKNIPIAFRRKVGVQQ